MSDAISKYNQAFQSNVKSLKPMQEKALEVLMNGQDCICSLPTGDAYVQEIGRSGRAGSSAHAILYYNNGDLAVQGMRQEMKEYCKGVKCKRTTINEYFGFHSEQSLTVCCNFCQPMLGVEWDFENLSISELPGPLDI